MKKNSFVTDSIIANQRSCYNDSYPSLFRDIIPIFTLVSMKTPDWLLAHWWANRNHWKYLLNNSIWDTKPNQFPLLFLLDQWPHCKEDRKEAHNPNWGHDPPLKNTGLFSSLALKTATIMEGSNRKQSLLFCNINPWQTSEKKSKDSQKTDRNMVMHPVIQFQIMTLAAASQRIVAVTGEWRAAEKNDGASTLDPVGAS